MVDWDIALDIIFRRLRGSMVSCLKLLYQGVCFGLLRVGDDKISARGYEMFYVGFCETGYLSHQMFLWRIT